jgi:hypothetical protein
MTVTCVLVLLALALLPGRVVAEEPIFDYLPKVAYIGEDLHLSWRAPGDGAQPDWQVEADGKPQVIDRVGTASRLVIDPAGIKRIHISGGNWSTVVHLVTPGQEQLPDVAITGLLRYPDGPAVLVAPRVEAKADRRFRLLRGGPPNRGSSAVLAWPPAAPWGRSPLLAQSVATMPDDGRLVLQLSTSELLVGWPHREFRQLLAWYAERCLARQLELVLVQPPVSVVERPGMEGLWRQVRDVANAYGLDVIEVTDLSDASYWQLGEGVWSTTLLPAGRARLAERIAPLIEDLPWLPEGGP